MTISVIDATSLIQASLPEPHAAMLSGIVFGQKFGLPKELLDEMKTVGIIHIMVLSGSNISLLAAFISSLAPYIGIRMTIVITVLTVIFFVGFVGLEAPIVRAAIMCSLTFVAVALGRRTFSLYSLLVSFLIIIIFWPHWLKTASFWLSYAATLGIILFGSGTVQKNNLSLTQKVKAYVREDLKLSFAAQIFTTPIILFLYHRVSLIAPVTNVLISFTIAPLMVLGFVIPILGSIHPLLAFAPSLIAYGLLSYLVFIVHLLAKLPFAAFQF